MSEQTLIIDRKNIPKEWLIEKISKKILVVELEKLLPFIEWKNRSDAEADETVKQIIPYIIVESDEDRKIACYERKGSEKRIHGLYSIGVGGHIDKTDYKVGDKFIDLILRSAKREVFEEFETVTPKNRISFLGIINEELTKVGRTHLGLVFKLKITGKGKPSTELHNLQWLNKTDILREKKLEMWSKMALELENNLFDYFKDLELTSDQKNTLLEIEKFFKNDAQIFILKGYAGTGKTTLLKGIANYLKSIHHLGGLMAPTGRAAKVISKVTDLSGSTIHKAIYSLENIKTYQKKDKKGNESFKFYFDLKEALHNKKSVFIFDESSMIGNHYSEGEFFRFGSGYLLNDILRNFNVKTNNRLKLIFVGDPAQLPPVGSKHSPALTTKFFTSQDYSATESEMTEVVRQQENSGILYNASYYRKLIFSEKVPENHLNTRFDDIEELSYDDLAYEFVKQAPLPDVSKNIIITFSNERSRQNNRMIRELYFPGQKQICEGDILQIIKNNYASKLLNGEFVTITKTTDQTKRQSATIWVKNERTVFHFDFRQVTVQTDDGRLIDVMILDTLLNSKNRDLSSEEMKALYVNFIMRYEKKFGRANRKSSHFKESFRSDPYFNALQVKYGYSITGHKAQGGEWKNAFVDFSGRTGLSKDELRWTYTAITRAKEKLYVLTPPKQSRFELKNGDYAIGKVKKVPKSTVVLKEVPETTPFHNINTLPAKRARYVEAMKQIKNSEFTLINVESKDYQEIYSFKKDPLTYKVTMHHNAKGNFSTMFCNRSDENSVELLRLLRNQVDVDGFEYQPGTPLLKEVFNLIERSLTDTGLKIINVDESRLPNYQLVYVFKGEVSENYIQFFINKNDQITTLIAKSTMGEEDSSLRQLIQNIIQNQSHVI